jgi:hypothetical protein
MNLKKSLLGKSHKIDGRLRLCNAKKAFFKDLLKVFAMYSFGLHPPDNILAFVYDEAL